MKSQIKNRPRRRLLLLLPVAFLTMLIYAKISRTEKDFAAAEDFPREALIFVQIRDLPAALRLWNESKLKEDYLASRNFAEFSNHHLALKLAARFEEIESATGFFPGAEALAGLSETRAALAVYDIGKFEFVFIAPMSEEKILASGFFLNSANFQEIKLDEETVVYRTEAEVDRGRQIQKIFFANFRGRLIAATSEKHFLQTLDNIRGKTPQNRLSAEPDFQKTAAQTKPHLASVWLNQAKLNENWYFKHYWLMPDAARLKNLRAGMFDFEMRADRLIERRVFLTNTNQNAAQINTASARRLLSMIPSNVAFFRIQTPSRKNFGALISETLFDREFSSTGETSFRAAKNYSFRDRSKSYSYDYLDSDFGRGIDEQESQIAAQNDFGEQTERKLNADLNAVISNAEPSAKVQLFAPQTQDEPLFFDNRKALIFSLSNPALFDRHKTERILVESAKLFHTVGTENAGFAWENLTGAKFPARRLKMPSLGWAIFYAVRKNELIFTNSREFLLEILAAKENQIKIENAFEEFSLIRLSERENAFDKPMKMMRDEETENGKYESNDFFADNIASLLDVVSDVERIEIRRSRREKLIFEEISFVLKPANFAEKSGK